MAIISVRLALAERRAFREEGRKLGFESLSDFMRFKLGLERGSGSVSPLPDLDEENLAKSVHSLIERVDDVDVLVRRIARHLSVPLNPEQRVYPAKPDPAAVNGGFQR